jgi:hypothetical protein
MVIEARGYRVKGDVDYVLWVINIRYAMGYKVQR